MPSSTLTATYTIPAVGATGTATLAAVTALPQYSYVFIQNPVNDSPPYVAFVKAVGPGPNQLTLLTLSLGAAIAGGTFTAGTVVTFNPFPVGPLNRQYQTVIWAGDPTLLTPFHGDGVTPDDGAFADAITAINASNGTLVLTDRYLVTQPIVVDGTCAIIGLPLRAEDNPPTSSTTTPATVVAQHNGFKNASGEPAGVFEISAPFVTIRDLQIEVSGVPFGGADAGYDYPQPAQGASTIAVHILQGGKSAVIERVRAIYTYFGFLVDGPGQCDFRWCRHITGELSVPGPLPPDPTQYLQPTWNGSSGHFGTRYSFKATTINGGNGSGVYFTRCNQDNPPHGDTHSNYRTVDMFVHGSGFASFFTLECGSVGAYRWKFSTDEVGTVLTPTLFTGTIPATTYFVRRTYFTTTGESLPGTEFSLTVPANAVLTVAPPPGVPNATGWNVYASTVSMSERKQNTSVLSLASSWTEPTSGLTTTGPLVPTSGPPGPIDTVSAPNFGHSVLCNSDHCLAGIVVQNGQIEVHTGMLITSDDADLTGAPVILVSASAMTALFSNMHVGNTGGGVRIQCPGVVSWIGGTMTNVRMADAFYIEQPSLPATANAVTIDAVTINQVSQSILSSISGGTMSPTTYFVRRTYVSPAGETTADVEISTALGMHELLVVQPPPPINGATDWNVYVSSSSGTETKQTLAPISLSMQWTELTSGLITTLGPPPTTNTAQLLAPSDPASGAALHLGNAHDGFAEIVGNNLGNSEWGFLCDDFMAVGLYKLAYNFFATSFEQAPFHDLNGDSATVTTINYNRWIHGNHGTFQPIGFIGPANLGTVPSIPTGTMPVQNPFGVDCTIYVTAGTGGTITAIKVGNGYGGLGLQPISSAMVPGPIVVPVRVAAGQTIHVDGTGTLSWTWFGD